LVDLAGRSIRISPDIPVMFDQPLSPHHKLIGRWVAGRDQAATLYTRPAARQHIERVFNAAVLEALNSITLAELRVVALNGNDERPPALAFICDSIGQLDLGWIETSNAPIPWRAAAYAALEQALGTALPVFTYDDLFEEISTYYWEGETDDEGARHSLIECHGADPSELDDYSLPSTMNARRPDWMFSENAAAYGDLPKALRKALKTLRNTVRDLRRTSPERNAWHCDFDILYDYVPGLEECSSLPPLTLVPVEYFAREVDDVGRHGMEYGFMDVIGLCPLEDADHVTGWLASLEIGVRFLLAAQELINLDPDRL
jgi:hypothetical protein